VLKREIRIIVEETVFDLREGDAMAFDPQRPHNFLNPSRQEPARVLFAMTPPPL
jgi:hypothetical protein